MISKSRYCSKAGGLIIYIHNDFNFKHVDISTKMSDNDETKPSWESLFIEIKHKSTNSKTHIIGHIYRRPIDIVSSCNNFSTAFAETLTLLQKKKQSIYIAGDFNIDLLKINEKLHYSTFLENIISSGFYPRISLPTRYNRNTGSATLINTIFANHIANSTSGVFTNEISDHQMIYTYSNESFLNNNPAKYIDIESNTNEKLNNFLIELQNIDLTTKLNQTPFSNPSKNDDTFINILTNIKQRLLPKTKKVKFNKKKQKNLSG